MPPTETGSLASTFTKTRSPTGETVLYCASTGGPSPACYAQIHKEELSACVDA